MILVLCFLYIVLCMYVLILPSDDQSVNQLNLEFSTHTQMGHLKVFTISYIEVYLNLGLWCYIRDLNYEQSNQRRS